MDDGNYPYAKDIGRTLAKTKLNNSHRGIIDVVLDKTYGWEDPESKKISKLKQRKINEKIDFKFFREFTGIPFCKLSIMIRALVEWKILKRKKQGRNHIYSFNVMVKEWDRRVFKKRFQKEGWGMVYQVVNFTNQETLPGSKPIVYQVVNSQFTNQETKNLKNNNINEPSSVPKETLKRNSLKETIYMSDKSDVLEVFNYWKQTFNHPKALLSSDRQRKIKARLREGYTISQLKQAIDGCRASPYHMGDNNSGRTYDTIGLIFRNAEKVEFFWGYLEKKKEEEDNLPTLTMEE